MYKIRVMTAYELISSEIPPLKHTDTGETALLWMEEFKVLHLPVLKNGNFVGVVSENDILDQTDLNANLDALFQHLPRPYVTKNAHIYEVLWRINQSKVTVIPILDDEENYLGCTSVLQIMNYFAETGGIKEPGGILEFELNQQDYSLAQIAQIVESNNARILSSYISHIPESTLIKVTLKINQVELSSIIRTFERYDYVITATYQKSDVEDDLQNRFDSLMFFLNI